MKRDSLIKRLKALLLTYGLVLFIRSANALFIYSLTISYNISTHIQGFIQGSYSLTEGFSGFLSGFLYERLGLTRTLIVASALLTISYAASLMIYGSSISPTTLIYPQIVAGFAASLIIVSSIALVSEETYMISFRGRLFGSGGLEISNLLGYAAGFLIAGLIEFFSPGLVRGFMLSLAMASTGLVIALILSREVKHTDRYVARFGVKEIYYIEKRSLYLVPMWFGVSIILGVAFISVKIFRELISKGSMTMLQEITPHGHGGGLSVAMLIAVALLAIGILVGSYLSSVSGRTRSLLIGSIATPVALVSLGYFVSEFIKRGVSIKIYEILYSPDLVLSGFVMILAASLALMLPPSLLALLAEFTDIKRVRGPSSGVYVSTLGIGIFLGNIVGGYIFDLYGLVVLTLVLSAIFTPLGLLTYLLVRRVYRGE